MSEDMSNIFNKMNDMLKNNQIPDEIKNMMREFSSNSSTNSSCSPNSTSNSDSNNNNFTNSSSNGMSSYNSFSRENVNSDNSNFIDNKFGNNNSDSSQHGNQEANSDFPNFDINTMLKMKSIIDGMNKSQNDPRANLLKSLKPYLRSSRRDKVDQYVKLFSMGKVFEVMNPLGGDKKNDV